MKSKKNLLDSLKLLPYFDKHAIYQLGSQLGLKNTSINTYISRYLKYKDIIQLKRGLYIATDFREKNRGDLAYIFYLANVLRSPSYVSSWAALQYYDLTTEITYSIDSVTTKTTRNYETKLGNFEYKSIKKDLFSDFVLIKGRFDFFIATPAKALFDLIYFRTNQFRGLSLNDIKKITEDLRIETTEMSNEDTLAFEKMINRAIS